MKKIEFVAKIGGLIATLFLFLSKYFDYFNMVRASNFYNIPLDYFTDDGLKYSLVSKILVFIIPILLFISPALYKDVVGDFRMKISEMMMMSFAIGTLVLIIFMGDILNLAFLFVKEDTKVQTMAILGIVVYFAFVLLFSFLYYNFFLKKIFGMPIKENWQKTKVIGSLLIPALIVGVFVYKSFTISKNMKLNTRYSVDNGTNYQVIIKDRNGGCSMVDIIVVRKDKNAVIVKGHLKNKILTIYSGRYRIEDISSKEITNYEVDEVEVW